MIGFTRESDRISIVTRSIGATVFLLVAFLLTAPPAQAQWCANYQSGGRNCYFKTQAQCLASISGAGGTCSPNPADGPAAVERRAPPTPPVRRTTQERPKPPKKEAPRQVRDSAPPTAASVAAKPPAQGALPAKFNEARQLVLEGQYESGVAALHALNRDDHPDVATFLGLGYSKMGRNDQAVFYYDKVLAANPNHLLALSYDGMLKASLGDRRSAQASLEKLRRLCGTECNEYKALEAVVTAQSR